MNDPYKTLKVNRSASDEEIKSAFRKLSMRWHPDRNPGDEKAVARFKEVQAAYELLSDPERRARFDATGDTSELKEAPILSVVGAMLSAVISEVTGRYMDLTQTDLVGVMKEKLAKNREDGDVEPCTGHGPRISSFDRSHGAKRSKARTCVRLTRERTSANRTPGIDKIQNKLFNLRNIR